MKKVLLLVWLALLGLAGNHAQAQCRDSVMWDEFSLNTNKCHWSTEAGADWHFGTCNNSIFSNGDDTTRDHRLRSPWVWIPATAANDQLTLIYSFLASCDGDYSICVTADGVTFDTLYRGLNSYNNVLYLGDYAGQWVRMEICHYALNSTWRPDTRCRDLNPRHPQGIRMGDLSLKKLARPSVITAHPWYADIENSFHCWHQLGASRWGRVSRNDRLYIVSGVEGSGAIASPAIAIPSDTLGLRLYWEDESFTASENYYVMASRGDRFNLSSYDTLYAGTAVNTLTQRSISLAAYAGDTIYIAFYHGEDGFGVYITDIKMYNALTPMGTLEASATTVAIGDTVHYTIHPTQGNSLTYSWHSTLLDTTFITTDSTLAVAYPFAGQDTLTATVNNPYGTIQFENKLGVFECDTITTFPWREHFWGTGAEAGYNTCWEISGYHYKDWILCFEDEAMDSKTWNFYSKEDMMQCTDPEGYMITPAIAVPTIIENNLSLWIVHYMNLRAIIETEVGADTIFSRSENYENIYHTVPLARYAGQTIRVRLEATGSQFSFVDLVGVDYDTLPVVTIAGQVKRTSTDKSALFTATLRRGYREGITYSWHSALGGSFVTNAAGDSAWVTYSDGLTGTEDTVSVVASNAYGSDTASCTIHVKDCAPALTLPWTEDFANGIGCWYQPEGSNFVLYNSVSNDFLNSVSPYINRYNEIKSSCNSDTIDSWIISKAINMPADTNVVVILEWRTKSSRNSFVHTYEVLVTTADDFTDTSLYQTVYFDSAAFGSVLREANLREYLGETIHIAFRNRPVNWNRNNCDLFFDDITIHYANEPAVTMVADRSTLHAGDTATFTATLTEGAPCRYIWHSTLLGLTDTAGRQWSTVYTIGGYDTITVVAVNDYGTATASTVVYVSNCIPLTLPWFEDFEAMAGTGISNVGPFPDCWLSHWKGKDNYAPHVINSFPGMRISSYFTNNQALMMNAGTDRNRDSVVTVEGPLLAGSLHNKRLSFFYMHEEASQGQLSFGYMQDSLFVNLADLPKQHTGLTVTLSLDSIPDSVDRFALQWKRIGLEYSVIIDSVRIWDYDQPEVTFSHTTAHVGDSTIYTSHLNVCDTHGLTYTWHSSLLDTTLVTSDATITLVYSTAGTDTMTLIARNTHAADTTVATVTVMYCTLDTLPWTEDFNSEAGTTYNVAGSFPTCWRRHWNGADNYVPHIINNFYAGNICNYVTHNQALALMAGQQEGFAKEVTIESPKVVGGLNDKQLSFYYLHEKQIYGQLSLGYFQDSTFIPVIDLPKQETGMTVDLLLDGIPTNVDRFALQWKNSHTWYSVIIDDIRLSVSDSVLPIRGIINGPETVDPGETNTYTARLLSGPTMGLSFAWRSSMADAGHATMTSNGNTLRIVHTTGGTDTLTLVTSNATGSDTTTLTVTVSNCIIETFPWKENFENGADPCWKLSTFANGVTHWKLRDDNNHSNSGSHYIMSPSASSSDPNNWFGLPPVNVPSNSLADTAGNLGGAPLMLSFYANTQPTLLVSTTGSDWSHFTDTLHPEETSLPRNYSHQLYSVSLAAYAGQTVWIAFVHRNRSSLLAVDDISIAHTVPPLANISGPTTWLSDDEAIFTAHLLSGDTAGVTYTWHSTMASAGLATLTATDTTAVIEYHTGGTDHVSVTVANSAGSNRVSMDCSVTNCEPITQLPYTANMKYGGTSLACWRLGEWDRDFLSGVFLHSNSPADQWLITREIAIPADYTQNYTLRWHMFCHYSKYEVLVSTQGHNGPFTSLYHGQHGYANQMESHTLSLNAYRGQNVSIAFRYLGRLQSGGSYSEIRFDTIQILLSPDTNTYRTLTLDVNDPAMGTVSGGGVYLNGSTVTMAATPFEGYHFEEWSDGDTNATRTLTLVSDSTFTAHFAADLPPTPDTVWRTVSVTANAAGACEPYGSGRYADSSTVAIGYLVADTATEGGHWEFQGWSDNGSGNPRNILVVSDTAIVALFEWVPDSIGIGEARGAECAVRVYPNPATTDVTVRVGQPSVLSVIDLQGRTLLSPTPVADTYVIPHTALPQGTYFLRVVSAESTVVRKLVVR